MTLCRGTLLGPPPTGHVRRFIDSGVFVLPVGGPSRSLLEVRGAPWVALPALICSFEAASSRFKFDGNFVRDLEKWISRVFLGFPFQKLFKEVFGRNVDAFPSFTAMVFSHPGAAFWTEGVARAGAAAARGKSS